MKLAPYEQQQEAAHLGGEAKERSRQAAVAVYLDGMPPLRDEASAKRRVEVISDLAVRGLLAGSQAGAAVRAVETWLKLREHELDRARFTELEAKLSELEAELARARKGRG